MPKFARDFEKVRLREVLEQVRNPVNVVPTQKYQEIGIRSHGKGIFHKEPVLGESLGNKSVFWIEPNCLVLNIVFAWEGAVALTSDCESGMIASHRFPMYKSKKNRVYPDYLRRLFSTKYGKSLLALASPGGAGRNKTLGKDRFLKLTVPLPPIAEQKRIVEILEAWDGAIAIVEQLITAKKILKRQLGKKLFNIEYLFSGKDPCIKRLEHLSTSFSGGTPSRSNLEYFGGDIPWIKSGEINQEFIFVTEESITKAGLENSSARIVESGSILVAMYGATAGKIAINHIDAAINQAILAIIPNPELDRDFLYYFLQASISEVVKKVQGGQPNLNAKIIKETKIPVPPINQQQSVSELLEFLDQDINYLTSLSSLYRRQKQGLMQKLLTGDWRVQVESGVAA